MQDTDESVDLTGKVLVSIGEFVKQRQFMEIGALRHQQRIIPRNNGEHRSHLTSTSGSLVVRTASVESQEAFEEENTAPHCATIQIKM